MTITKEFAQKIIEIIEAENAFQVNAVEVAGSDMVIVIPEAPEVRGPRLGFMSQCGPVRIVNDLGKEQTRIEREDI